MGVADDRRLDGSSGVLSGLLGLAERGLNRLSAFFLAAVAISIGLIAILIPIDLIFVKIGHLFEGIEVVLYFGLFLGAPWVLLHDGHVKVDLFVTLMPEKASARLNQFLNVLGLLLCALLCFYGTRMMISEFESGSVPDKGLRVPNWIILIAFVSSFFMLAAVFLFRTQPTWLIGSAVVLLLLVTGYFVFLHGAIPPPEQWAIGMKWYWAFALMLGTVCTIMFLGMPVALAFFAANILGTALFIGGDRMLVFMPLEFYNAINFSLVAITLFLLMGEILLQTGVAFKAIGAIDRMIAKVPGRLSVVSIVGGTIFSSLSGSTIANTAILGSVLLPDMMERGYKPSIAMGPIMAVGGIAMLIPPSALAVLLASLAEQSVAQLLIAGIIPGILMAILFFAYVICRCAIDPTLAPGYTQDETVFDEPITVALNSKGNTVWSWTYHGRARRMVNRLLPFCLYVLPLSVIFFVVMGSIFFKLATPEAAAALGCIAALGACYFFKLFKERVTITGVDGADFSLREIFKSLMETAKVNTTILFIIAGSLVFSQAIANSGATNGLLNAVTTLDLTKLQVVIIMILVLLFLGAFMDQVSMLLLTLPFFLLGSQSLQVAFDIDVVWLMVLILISMEISLLTPPFGLLLYVMKGVAPFDVSIGQVISSALPFILIELLVLSLLIVFPEIATWLPKSVN